MSTETLTDQEVIDLLVAALEKAIPALEGGRNVADHESVTRVVYECDDAMYQARQALTAARTRVQP